MRLGEEEALDMHLKIMPLAVVDVQLHLKIHFFLLNKMLLQQFLKISHYLLLFFGQLLHRR